MQSILTGYPNKRAERGHNLDYWAYNVGQAVGDMKGHTTVKGEVERLLNEYLEALALYRTQAQPPALDLANAIRPLAILKDTLGDVEELLPPEIFQRIHHSTLVNVTYIAQFLRTDGGYVVLKNSEKLSVSKAKKEMLMARLGLK